MRIEIAVAEADLAYVVPGMKVGIEFNWDVNQEHRMEGAISEISYNVADPEAEARPCTRRMSISRRMNPCDWA